MYKSVYICPSTHCIGITIASTHAENNSIDTYRKQQSRVDVKGNALAVPFIPHTLRSPFISLATQTWQVCSLSH